MGLPYSKQINAAFDQVTPLVAAGFEVLQTTKNISLFVAVIQVLTVVFLALILVVLFGVLISINPDLEQERDVLVTPVVRGAAALILRIGSGLAWGMLVVGVGVAVGVGWGVWYTARDPTLRIEGEEGWDGESSGGAGSGELKGEDIEAIKKGEAKQ